MTEVLTDIQEKRLRWITIIYLVVLNIHSYFFEPTFVSPIKVGLMSLAPFIFIFYVPQFTKAALCGILYWVYCFLSAFFNGNMRFSTIGYMGLFVMTFIVYYNSIYDGILNFNQFKKVLRYLIYAYAICLLLQQACLIIGIHNFPLINLIGNSYMELGRLPSLSLEPNHTAIIMTFAFLCYLRCSQIEYGEKITIKSLFDSENRNVTFAFFWVMLTMGSGTAYFGLIGLAPYFINKKNIICVVGILILLIVAIPHIENEQLERASKVSSALMTGDNAEIVKADLSGATRIVPLINTFTKSDLTKIKTWFGYGTLSKNDAYNDAWKQLSDANYFVLQIVRQYGLIGWLCSILLLYICCIRRFFSVETLLWFTLGMATLGNVYFQWGIILMMAGVRYFETQALDEEVYQSVDS